MTDVFWENSYKNDTVNTFGNPSKEVELLVNKIPDDSNILDMGCGDGRHSLYLDYRRFSNIYF